MTFNTIKTRPSVRSRLIRSFVVNRIMKPQFDLDKNSVEEMRLGLKKISKFIKLPRGTSIINEDVAGMSAEWVSAKNVSKDNESVIPHFHGGGILTGSCENPPRPCGQDISCKRFTCFASRIQAGTGT